MPFSTALQGAVEQKNIKLGGWRFFVGPFDSYIDEYVRFDTISPPTPFRDLGAASQDSTAAFTKNLYKYTAGVPRILKQVKVISLDLTLNLSLDEFSGANLSRALFNTNYAIKKFKSSPAIVQSLTIPTSNVVSLTSSSGWLEGDFIALAISPSGLVNTIDEYRIVEVSGSFLILDRDVTTVFTAAPYIGDIESWKVPYGTSKINKIALVACWDEDVEGTQLVIAIPRAVIDGNFNSGIPANSHQLINMVVTGQAFYDTDIDDQSIANIIKFAD